VGHYIGNGDFFPGQFTNDGLSGHNANLSDEKPTFSRPDDRSRSNSGPIGIIPNGLRSCCSMIVPLAYPDAIIIYDIDRYIRTHDWPVFHIQAW